MLECYWPLEYQVDQCIRTEAEELAEYVLLAVHEPMVLTRSEINRDNDIEKTEEDLLNHLLKTERPIPIVGESGSGKSHLIRWLHAKLTVHPSASNWHIRRIPKNSSLPNVLHTLLEGMEGQEFDTAREKIREVGERLTTRQLADHLIVFMSHRLVELWERAKQEKKEINDKGRVDQETKDRLKRISTHAKNTALPALLGDSHYKSRLVEEGKCIYQIADRLIKGSTEKELENNDYKITIKDLDFSSSNFEVRDLSRDARDYILKACLQTQTERVDEAINLLNEVLNTACRNAFQQLFQFTGGSFQDLFRDIRKQLKLENKTLVVLVEDMTAISAIEDILIDSLMEEGVRDGEETLCAIRSVIAVTTKYEGYVRRRNTLATRAQYEWYIDKQPGNPEETYGRIQNFCGRYLNAARHGKDVLEASYQPQQIGKEWPGIWHSPDPDEKELVSVFEYAPNGYPLFPYNRASLRVLTDNHCTIANRELVFNPRDILRHILFNILKSYREKFVKGEFPPVDFLEASCPSTLADEIDHSVVEDTERAQTVAAIWGYRADDIEQLVSIMEPQVAQVFSLESLFGVLDSTTPKRAVRKVKGQPRPSEIKKKKRDNQPVVEFHRQISKNVDEWFKKENEDIPQKEANIIRRRLVEEIQTYWKCDYYKWVGLGKSELPTLKRNSYLIDIPFNTNNPPMTMASFGSEKEFKKNPLKYKLFIIALLHNEEGDSWDYPDGYQDSCIYQNFIGEWVPEAISLMIKKRREEATQSITEHFSKACVFDPGIGQKSLEERVSLLCTAQEDLEERTVNTGVDAWDVYRRDVLKTWSNLQEKWLFLYATNHHGLEGDLLRSLLRGAGEKSIPPSISKAAQSAREQLLERYPSFELLEGCSDQEQFNKICKAVWDLVEALASKSQYKDMSEEMTARKYMNRINKLLGADHWPSVKALLNLRNPFEAKSSIRALNELNSESSEAVNEVLCHWESVYKKNKSRMEAENNAQGGDQRKDKKEVLDRVISQTKDVLTKLETIS